MIICRAFCAPIRPIWVGGSSTSISSPATTSGLISRALRREIRLGPVSSSETIIDWKALTASVLRSMLTRRPSATPRLLRAAASSADSIAWMISSRLTPRSRSM